MSVSPTPEHSTYWPVSNWHMPRNLKDVILPTLIIGYQILICPDISYKATKPGSKLLSIERESIHELKGQK